MACPEMSLKLRERENAPVTKLQPAADFSPPVADFTSLVEGGLKPAAD